MLNTDKFFDDPKRAVSLGLGAYSPLWPTFIAAAGAGVAFWAWAQWARGKAQSEFAGAVAAEIPVVEPAAFAAPPPEAAPEPAAPVAFANDPAPSLTPPDPEPADAPPAAEALDESLAVQGTTDPEPEPEPAPTTLKAPEPAARKRSAPLIAAPRPHTVIETVAPEAAVPAAASRKAKALASAAAVSPRKARAAKAAGTVAPSKRSSRKR